MKAVSPSLSKSPGFLSVAPAVLEALFHDPIWAADRKPCYFADPSVNWTDSLETNPSTGVVSSTLNPKPCLGCRLRALLLCGSVGELDRQPGDRPSTGVVSFNSTAHRKIRVYQDLGNGVDSGGHGTHTMGSLLGQPLNTSDLGSLDYRQCTANGNRVLLSPWG